MSLSDEVEAWLAVDIPGHVEYIAQIARLAERRTSWSDRLSIPQTGAGWGMRYVEIDECEPGDLRAIADAHEAAAAELIEHASELRDYAIGLEGGSDLGAQLAEHFRAMRESRACRKAERDHAYAVAEAEGGVLVRFGTRELGYTLMHGGLLTVDDVRRALVDGRLLRVKGIGPARFTQIARELSGDTSPNGDAR